MHSTSIAHMRALSCFHLLSVIILILTVCFVANGQSALDGFDPNANALVRVVVQPDGEILIGGDFTTLSPNGGVAVTRNRIARLNPDGTLDTAFAPNANSTVRSIAVEATAASPGERSRTGKDVPGAFTDREKEGFADPQTIYDGLMQLSTRSNCYVPFNHF
jgi:hypothetical protein